MRRSRPLRADPEKVRAFVARGRAVSGLRRGGIRKQAAKRGVVVAEGPLSPAAWRAAVFAASGGRCVITGSRAYGVDDRRFHAHHPVSQSVLRRRGLHGWLWDPRNGMFVTADRHMAHEHSGGHHRIGREFVPVSVWEFAAELDELDGTSWATAHVERYHPASGSRRGRKWS